MEEAEADFEANIADLAMRFNPTLEPQPPPGSDYPTLEKDDDDDTAGNNNDDDDGTGKKGLKDRIKDKLHRN